MEVKTIEACCEPLLSTALTDAEAADLATAIVRILRERDLTGARAAALAAVKLIQQGAAPLGKLSDGACVARYGDTMVLATVNSAKAPDGIDFFPLTVDYREKTSAAGVPRPSP